MFGPRKTLSASQWGVWTMAIATVSVSAGLGVAVADERLVALGDFGNQVDARPDGFSDRLLWDDTRGCLLVHYLGGNGLDRDDRLGQVIAISVVEPGEGYGRSMPGPDGPRVITVPITSIDEHHRAELLPGDDVDAGDVELELWAVPLVVNNDGTEGHGLDAYAILDGRGGAWSYYPVTHPWENPLLGPADFTISTDDNDLTITHGGSGYYVAPGVTSLDRGRLRIRLTGGDELGTLGFSPGGDLTTTSYFPGREDMIDETLTSIEITGDILNPIARRPGNWRNFLAHTPATTDASQGWQLPWAATRPGQIAELVIPSDGRGLEPVELESTEVEHDPLGQDQVRNTHEEKLSTDEPDVDVDQVEDFEVVADLSGETEAPSPTFSTEPTCGIGYEPGVFEIRDREGQLVSGWVIRYETDSEGRIYVNAKGSACREPGNMARQRVGMPGGAIYQYGWEIERNPAAITDARGWTIQPQGDGTGFACSDIRLFGELIALPPITNRTDSSEGFNVKSVPGIEVEIVAGHHGTALAEIPPDFMMRAPALGRIIGTLMMDTGAEYYRTPILSMPGHDHDVSGKLVAVLGDDGRRPLTTGGEIATVDLDGWDVHADGDFNGDGIADLLMHDPASGDSVIWNLDHGGKVRGHGEHVEAGALPSLPSHWQIGGIGRFGLEQSGCCIIWRNGLTGENVLWIVNSSSDDPASWIQPGSDYLPTVIDAGWAMACTNNATCNSGERLYWMDPSVGSVAQWRIDVDITRPGSEWVSEPEYVRDAQGEPILGMNSSWELVDVGSLGGHPRTEGSNAFRDLLFFDHETGRSAIWLLDASCTRIDESAPNGGAGYVRRGGSVIGGPIQGYQPVGIGQYALDSVRWSLAGDGNETERTQWFPTLGWDLPGSQAWFTWRFDRSIDPIRHRQGVTRGTGKSLRPYRIDDLR